MRVVRQLSVEDTVKAAGFICIATQRVLVSLGSSGEEVVRLSLHGPKTTHLPHEPAHGLPILLRAERVRDLMVLVVSGDNVQQNRTGLKDLNLLTVL